MERCPYSKIHTRRRARYATDKEQKTHRQTKITAGVYDLKRVFYDATTDLHARSSLRVELAHMVSDFLGEEATAPFLLVSKHARFSRASYFIGPQAAILTCSTN
jgi:hypothetical protein